MITSLTSDTLQVLALFAVGDVYVSRCKKVLTLHLAYGEGRERYFGCNLMQRKVLASSHQHLMAEAPMHVSPAVHSLSVGGEVPEFHISTMIFQEPSSCFSQRCSSLTC